MRLFSYYDQFDVPTFGVLVTNGLLTAEMLTGQGGLDAELASLGLGLLVGEPDLPDILGAAVERALAAGATPVSAASVRPAPAIPDPGKIVCIGLNYAGHVAEQKVQQPDRPMLFAKFANAVVADGEPVIHPSGTHALDLEAELAVVIGRRARRVRASDALGHVAGYVVANDISARDWQGQKVALGAGEHGDGQWLRAKGSDTFFPMGPVLLTADELAGSPELAIRSWRTPGGGPDAGKPILMQESNTRDLVFDVPALVAFVSQSITLDPGDIISTGTPAGVGVFRNPPVYLLPGDRVRVEIERIGSVENPIIDEMVATS